MKATNKSTNYCFESAKYSQYKKKESKPITPPLSILMGPPGHRKIRRSLFTEIAVLDREKLSILIAPKET